MNIIEKSESIRAGLRRGFQDGTSKMAQRDAMDMTSAQTVSWSLILMKPLLSAGSLSATSMATAWARLPLV